jgi:hypothetical protein
MAKPIGTLGTIETLTVGGRVFTDLTNLIVLTTGSGTLARNSVFYKSDSGAPAAYQVPGATSFFVDVLMSSVAYVPASELFSVSLFYTDDNIGNENAGTGTNPVYWPANLTSVCITDRQTFYYPRWTIPTGKYLNGAFTYRGGYQVFGYEV